MVFTKKFSEFSQGNVDEPVGLTNGQNTIGQTGGDSSGGVIITIVQDTSALSAAKWVRFDDATQLYVEALADSSENAEVAGVVLEVLSSTEFRLQQSGYIETGTAGFSGFVTSGTYFLSDLSAGDMTLTVPTENGKIRLPLFNADSADSGWICSLKSGMVIGSPGPINGGGSTPEDDTSIIQVSQAGNGFAVGKWLKVSGNKVYSLAQADTFDNSQSVGVVIDDGDPVFSLQFSGYNTGAVINAVDSVGAQIDLVSGTVYYLSDVVAGKICPTKPTDTLTSAKPCYICESATDFTGYILDQQPLEINPGSESPNTVIVNQSTAGLAVEDAMRVSSSGVYTKALADTLPNSRAVGLIVEIIPPNHFVLQTSGFTDKFSAKTPATQYYLSATTPGALTATEPTTDGEISKPLFQALTANSGYILEQRPLLQPSANGGATSGSIPSNVVQTVIAGSYDWTTVSGTNPIPQTSVVITPSSATSRVKITVTARMTATLGRAALYRNGVIISLLGTYVTAPTDNTGEYTEGFTYIDSPATTSPVDYRIGITPGGNSLQVGFTFPDILSYFIAEEIGPA